MRTAIFAFFLALLCDTSAHAAGDNSDTILWTEVGSWTVALDKTVGNKCFIVTSFEGGYVLRLGFSQDGAVNPAYMAIASVDWKSLDVGKDYELSIQFDRNSPWTATATAVMFGGEDGTVALSIGLDKIAFFEEFARKLGVRLFYQNKQIAHLSLRGSSRAIVELMNCQKTVNEYLASQPEQRDPFDDATPKKAKDPFAT
ncbi:hypothetical protein [Rhizobium sp. L1K21]|uniref:hypothetical protein n=1 Tax=Rhizobium sp. L1K21 TaxID=2954933 RepID=UPI0020928D45|nr:hypothetical protein [Rhizobium sp. L1K21]MCO6186296.1 hypothetical protein [Rhizobium sp. L1K21]